jgi:hypothetical protein
MRISAARRPTGPPELILMLTRRDLTVRDSLDVYQSTRGSRLNYVGFKDVGAEPETLATLVSQIHADGRRAVLEVVSEDAESEVHSISLGLELGVDIIMGGTHVSRGAALISGSDVDYFPFPGHVVGHPSRLEGTSEGIVASAVSIGSVPAVTGLDLLAYRWHGGNVPNLVTAVVQAVAVPVVVAGSIETDRQIAHVRAAGAWGFTIGSAFFDGKFPGDSVRAQVDHVLLLLAGDTKESPTS